MALNKEKISIEKVREYVDDAEPLEDAIWTIYELANGLLTIEDLIVEIKGRGK